MKRSERLHALAETLRRRGTRGCTAEWLASEFEVSVRTVKRDIAALERSGAAVWSRPGPGGGYGLVAARASLPPVNLTAAQGVALLSAVAAAPDAPYADLARSGIQKIFDVLDPQTRAQAQQLSDRVWVDRRPAPSRSIRSALEQAMTEQRVLRIGYADGRGVRTTRDVEPVLFAATGGDWYLVAWCRLRDAMRWFAFARIERAIVTSVTCMGHSVAEVGDPPDTARPVYDPAE